MFKIFFGKAKQSVKNCLNEHLVIWNFSKICFEVTLRSKTNVLSIWKWHFSVFCKFLRDEVETFLGGRRGAALKNFLNEKFVHLKLLINFFWSYLEVKNGRPEHLEITYFKLLQSFEWQCQNRFLGKRAEVSKTF